MPHEVDSPPTPGENFLDILSTIQSVNVTTMYKQIIATAAKIHNHLNYVLGSTTVQETKSELQVLSTVTYIESLTGH
jgi:hypothetical protein